VYVCVLTYRYDLPAAVGPRSSGLSFGHLPSELYSLLASGAGGYSLSSIAGFTSNKGPKHKVCVVTGEECTHSWAPVPSGWRLLPAAGTHAGDSFKLGLHETTFYCVLCVLSEGALLNCLAL
jgi:hypothetical protein